MAGDIGTVLGSDSALPGMSGAANVIANFTRVFPAVQELIFVLSTVMGIFVAGYGVYALTYARHSRSTRTTASGGGISLVMGTLMASLPYTMTIMTTTLFESAGPRTALSYAGSSGSSAGALIINSMLSLVALFGWYWGFKGMYLIHRSGHPQVGNPDDRGKGITRMIAAVMCCNLLFVTNLIAGLGGFSNPLAT
jgi:hypothetical protein